MQKIEGGVIMANVNGDNKNLMNKGASLPATTSQPKTINDFIKEMGPEIARAVPKHVSPDRITRIALTAFRTNPKLLECERNSLLAGIMTGAQLGLELNTPLGHAYLIPRKRKFKVGNEWKSVMEAQFQLGYQGIIDLAYRAGTYTDLYVEEVYANDTFGYRLGLHRDLDHTPCENEDRGELTHIYAVYHTKNGGFDFQVWSVGKILAHAKKYSDLWNKADQSWVGGEKCAWVANFVGMGKKTVLKALLKFAPKSIEFAAELDTDEKIKKEIAPNMFEVPAIDYTETTAIEDKTEGEVAQREPEKIGEVLKKKLDEMADTGETLAIHTTKELLNEAQKPAEPQPWTIDRINELIAKSNPLRLSISVKRLTPPEFIPIIEKHNGDLRAIVAEIEAMAAKPAPESKQPAMANSASSKADF